LQKILVMKIGKLARGGCDGSESVRSACVFKEISCHHVDIELLIDLDCDRKRVGGIIGPAFMGYLQRSETSHT
jgi:hypothetical protein